MGFLNPIYHVFAWLLVEIHAVSAHVVGESAAWSLAVVLLTVAVRLAIFPLFVKQVKSQRIMQTMQPKMKEIQARYKNDPERLQAEMMAMWREAGTNPFSGCLPMLLQIPVFFALFHTLREIKPKTATCNTHLVSCFPSDIAGFPQKDLFSAAHAKLFGVAPISASFKTAKDTLLALGGHQGSTRAVALILVVIMAATTFITTRQMLARSAATATGADAQAAQMMQMQKIMLYVFPVMMLFYGFYFPVGVLIYMLTTNVWTMGQQYVIIHRQEPAAAAATTTATPSGPAPGARPQNRTKGGPPPKAASQPTPTPESTPKPTRSTANVVLPPGGAIGGLMGGAPAGGAPRPAPAKRANPNRSKKKKRRGR